MSRKNKQRDKAAKRIVLIRNKGGKSRTADLSIGPDEDRPCTGLPELAGHITAECYTLAVEFEELFHNLGLRKVELDNLFNNLNDQVQDRNVSETHLMKCFDGAVLGPLRHLCQKLAELRAGTVQSEQCQVRSLMRSAASADESNFGKMLCAFEKKVEEILSLNQQDISGRQAIRTVLEETNRCAACGEQIKRRIVGQKLEGGKLQKGLEQKLDELVRQTARELTDEESVLHTREVLESRWEKLELLLDSYRQAKKSFVIAREEYNAKARTFFNEHDALGLYKGEWHRQKETIRYAEEFFNAASLAPFEFSDRLAKVERDEVLTMPDQEERAELEAGTPNPFPQLQDSRVEERVQNTIKDVVAAIDALDKPLVEPPKTCPITITELALCTLAAFVARYPNGKPHVASGRTSRKVYQSMLVPTQLTYGFTEEQFANAVQDIAKDRNDAEKKAWLQYFKKKRRSGKGWNYMYQPTAEGFAHAETLYPKLPSEFQERIFARHEALREEAANFRKKFRKKEQ